MPYKITFKKESYQKVLIEKAVTNFFGRTTNLSIKLNQSKLSTLEIWKIEVNDGI